MYVKLSNFKWNGKTVEVYQTDEWQRFKRAVGNREPEPVHVRKLRDSIEENELFTSIIVNEKWEVIDGQHRREAFSMLNRPVLVHLVPGLTSEDIKTFNVNMHNWKDDNYMNYYIELGNENYVKYREFQERTGFNHSASRNLLVGVSAASDAGAMSRQNAKNSKYRFAKGDFEVDDIAMKEAYTIAGLILSLDFRHKKSQSFIGAFQAMYRWFVEAGVEYDHERMQNAFSLYGRDYENRPKRLFEFKLDLQKLYNHNRQSRNKIIFLTAEELVSELAA